MSTLPSTTQNGRFIPRYEQLYRLLLKQIISMPKEYEFLPYENDIADEYGVSRNTVRRALSKLRKNGYIETTKKSGSRLLKRTIEAHRPIRYRESLSGCVAFIFSNDNPDPNVRTNIHWELINEAERIFQGSGISMVAYNLREDEWTLWTPEKIVESLKANAVRQVIIHPAVQEDEYPLRRLHRMLLNNGFRVILLFDSLYGAGVYSNYFNDNTSFTAVNTLPMMESALEQFFADVQEVIFVANAMQDEYAVPRALVCQDFASRHGKRFSHFTAENEVELDPYQKPVSPMVDMETVEKIEKRIKDNGKVVCLCANDETAYSLLSLMKECPENCIVVGHDNTLRAHENGFSSFDFNPYAQAEALLTLYVEANPDVRGILIGGRFVNRISGKEVYHNQTVERVK